MKRSLRRHRDTFGERQYHVISGTNPSSWFQALAFWSFAKDIRPFTWYASRNSARLSCLCDRQDHDPSILKEFSNWRILWPLVDNQVVSQISKGLMVLVGIGSGQRRGWIFSCLSSTPTIQNRRYCCGRCNFVQKDVRGQSLYSFSPSFPTFTDLHPFVLNSSLWSELMLTPLDVLFVTAFHSESFPTQPMKKRCGKLV